MSTTDWRVWKFELPTDTDDFIVPMPSGVNLSVQMQNGVPVLWAAVLPQTFEENGRRGHRFMWVGTGQPVPDAIKQFQQSYVGTVQLSTGIVLHLFRLYE